MRLSTHPEQAENCNIFRPQFGSAEESLDIGGRGGIRTHGGFHPTLDFESSALNRTQPPFLLIARIAGPATTAMIIATDCSFAIPKRNHQPAIFRSQEDDRKMCAFSASLL